MSKYKRCSCLPGDAPEMPKNSDLLVLVLCEGSGVKYTIGHYDTKEQHFVVPQQYGNAYLQPRFKTDYRGISVYAFKELERI